MDGNIGSIVQFLFGGSAGGVVGGTISTVYHKIKTDQRFDLIENRARDHELDVAKNYVTRTDMGSVIDRLDTMQEQIGTGFDRLYDKLDKKQDRP